MIYRDLKKRRNKAFFHDAMQTHGRGCVRFDQNEKKKEFTYKALAVALKKKTQEFLPFFHTLSLFSRLFSGLENCWENFKTFSRIQDSVRTLSLYTRTYKLSGTSATPI